jgi:hypothetical protein
MDELPDSGAVITALTIEHFALPIMELELVAVPVFGYPAGDEAGAG